MGNKNLGYLLLIIVVILTNLFILFDVPFTKQIFSFIFLTFIPGLLIIHILKLNEIGTTEKFILNVGISIAFAMIFGILINFLLIGIGYKKPLSTYIVLSSYDSSDCGFMYFEL